MQGRCLDIASISRYLHQIAALEDVLHVEGHVGSCSRCRDKLQRMRRHAEALFDEYGGERSAAPGCPALIALDHFLRGELRERQLVRIQEHLRGCPACWQWASARAGTSAGLEARLLDLLPTRVPDIDLRVAPLGVRVVTGADWFEAPAPTLAARLEIPEPPRPDPYVAHSRQLSFRRLTPAGLLRGRVDLFGLEGFRLAVAVDGCDAPAPLLLWTRLRVQAAGKRTPLVSGLSWLLEPGHYFLGMCTSEPPLLALSVENDFVTPASLAACGYDACRFGRFRLALTCFARAQALQPGAGGYAELHRITAAFAQGFGLTLSDGAWRWREVEPRPAALPRLPAIGMQDGALTNAAIAALVLALTRRSEAMAARRLVGRTGPHVSRRKFRPAYAAFMAQLRAALLQMETSVESPRHLS